MNTETLVRSRRAEDVEYWSDLVREFEQLLTEVALAVWFLRVEMSYKRSHEERFMEIVQQKQTQEPLIPKEEAEMLLLQILPRIITSFKDSLGSDYKYRS